MSQPTISVEGRRVYIQTRYGDPCVPALKRLGAHWEPQTKRWWLTSAKKAEVEAAVAASAGKTSKADDNRDADPEVIGKAAYKGRSYYVRWAGTCKTGTAKFHLCTLDGKIDFWADAALARWEKRYEESRTLSSIRRFVEERKAEEQVAAKSAPPKGETEAERLARWDAIIARAGRVRATKDDGSGPVTASIGLSREDKGGVAVGDVIRTAARKGKGKESFVVVSVSAPYYHSEDDCEDQDCFCGHYGWRTCYDAVRVAPTAEETAADAQVAADKAAKEQAAADLAALVKDIAAEATARPEWATTPAATWPQPVMVHTGAYPALYLGESEVYYHVPGYFACDWDYPAVHRTAPLTPELRERITRTIGQALRYGLVK